MKLRALWDRAESIKIQLARTNLTDFTEYVFGWDIQPFQSQWHRDFEAYKRLLIFASVEHGKSSHSSVALPLFRIGTNTDIRIALISNTGLQSEKFFGVVREMIEGDSEEAVRYRKVFPNVKKGSGIHRAWGPHAIIVERKSVWPDFTMVAIGVGKKFLGARYDLIIFDDILDFDNTATDTQRDKVFRWMMSTAMTRVVRSGQAIFICTGWHPEDAAHRIAESGQWVVRKTPAIGVTPNGLPDWENGVSAWPDSWPIERLKASAHEVGEIEFARQFLCLAVSDTLSRFKESAFEYSLDQGEKFFIATKYGHDKKEIHPVFAGVDLSIKRSQTNDPAAIFVGCVLPDNRRRLLDVRMGHWSGDDILDELEQLSLDYKQLVGVYVEDNAAQDYIVQFARNPFNPRTGKKRTKLPPVYGFTTTTQKYDPQYGIPSLSVELDHGLWIFPSAERRDGGQVHEKVRSLITGLRAWTPRDHTADQVMAMWFFREAVARLHGARVDTGGETYDFAKPEHQRWGSEAKPHMNERFF